MLDSTDGRNPGGRRLVLVPLEARGRRAIVLGLTLAVAAWLAVEAVRPAVAWYAGRDRNIQGLEQAVAWDPRNAELRVRLGHAYANLVPADPVRATAQYAAAMALRPTDSYSRLLLALLANGQGDRRAAHAALEEALRLDPENVNLRWEAALLFMEWGEREAALPHFKYVLGVNPAQRDAAFQLARTLLRPGEDPATLLPADVEGLTNVLVAALLHEDLALASIAWGRRAQLEPPLDEWIAKRYMALTIGKSNGTMAHAAWKSLASEGSSAGSTGAVWNGGFETERLLGWGLDWRIRKFWGVDVALDRFVAAAGSRSLRLTFNSFPTLDFDGVTQLVAVEPDRSYRLRALVKAVDFTTRSGLKLQVVVPGPIEQLLAETSTISGSTADWVRLETSVTTPPRTTLVMIKVRREPASEPEGNLGGKVWLDEVSLQ